MRVGAIICCRKRGNVQGDVGGEIVATADGEWRRNVHGVGRPEETVVVEHGDKRACGKLVPSGVDQIVPMAKNRLLSLVDVAVGERRRKKAEAER